MLYCCHSKKEKPNDIDPDSLGQPEVEGNIRGILEYLRAPKSRQQGLKTICDHSNSVITYVVNLAGISWMVLKTDAREADLPEKGIQTGAGY